MLCCVRPGRVTVRNARKKMNRVHLIVGCDLIGYNVRVNAEEGSPLDRAVAAVPGWVYRATGAFCFASFLAYRMTTRATYTNQGLFWLEAAVPALILMAYLTRSDPKRRARGAAGILLPFVASALPLCLASSPRTDFGLAHQDVILVTLCFPTALMLWGYLALNRSFSIMAEARELKTGGPYRWVAIPSTPARSSAVSSCSSGASVPRASLSGFSSPGSSRAARAPRRRPCSPLSRRTATTWTRFHEVYRASEGRGTKASPSSRGRGASHPPCRMLIPGRRGVPGSGHAYRSPSGGPAFRRVPDLIAESAPRSIGSVTPARASPGNRRSSADES